MLSFYGQPIKYMEEIIVNKVAASGLISLDLEEYRHKGERIIYDLKDNLFMGMILKEKDFREFLKNHDWTIYEGKNVAVICSEDVIIPTWAYMLLALHLQPYVNTFVLGDLQALETKLYQEALEKIDYKSYKDARVVVKGCSNDLIPPAVYMEISKKLKPYVRSLMFGEPCSTVPLYKRK